jgi:hypothetical protein
VLVVEQLVASNHVLASSNRQVCFFMRIAYQALRPRFYNGHG